MKQIENPLIRRLFLGLCYVSLEGANRAQIFFVVSWKTRKKVKARSTCGPISNLPEAFPPWVTTEGERLSCSSVFMAA